MKRGAATVVVALMALAMQALAQSTITLSGSGSYLNLTGGAELRLGGSAGTANQLLVSQGSGATPQWQSLTAGTGITISGLTISAQNTSAIWNANQLQGTPIASPLNPSLNQVLAWNGTQWTAASVTVLETDPQVDDGFSAGQIAFWTTSGTPRLIGSNNLTWSGTALSVTGNITATGNVSVGGNTTLGGTATNTVTIVAGTVTAANLPTGATTDDVLLITAAPGNQVKRIGSGALIGGYAWLLTGNGGTNPAVNFLGTTDAQPLVIRTNNVERLRVTATGNVGIGTAAPVALLHVAGTGRFDGQLTVTTGGASITGNVSVTGNITATGNVSATQFQGALQYSVSAGTGLTGGSFNNTGNVTLSLTNTGVTAGTYGSATQVPQITVDAQGRITSASNVAIAFPAETDPQVDDGFSAGQIAFWSTAVTPNRLVGSNNLTWSGTALSVTGNITATGNVSATQFQGALQYSISTAAGELTGGPFNNTGNVTLGLANTGVAAGTYGSATQIPVITVDAKGRITNASVVPVTGDNWGSQTAVTTAPITGNGTSGNPIGLAYNNTTLSVSGGQLTAKNTSAIWNAGQLCGTNLDCATLSGLGAGDAGKVLQWDGSKWTAAGIGAAGGWAVGGNALSSNGALGTTTNYAVIFITNNTEAMRLTTDQRLDFQGGSGSFRIDLPNNTNVGVGRIRANGFSTYSSLRWKEEVRTIENALDKVMRLRGIAFRWKPEYGGTPDIGFAMEEVNEVLPEIVDRNPETGELLGMDYSRITAVLVEALKQHVREQEQVNSRLQQENAELRQRVERLESLVEQLLRERGERGGTGTGVEIHDAWLGQNIPNPFEGTTTIPYYVPAGVSRAELVVRDLGGRELRRVELPERGAHGQVVLEMRLLGSGTYEYSLVLDGRVVATKQMTLVR